MEEKTTERIKEVVIVLLIVILAGLSYSVYKRGASSPCNFTSFIGVFSGIVFVISCFILFGLLVKFCIESEKRRED